MGFAEGIGRDMAQLRAQRLGSMEYSYSGTSPFVAFEKVAKGGGLSYDLLRSFAPKYSRVLGVLERRGVSPDDAFLAVQDRIVHMRWKGYTDSEIAEDMGLTWDGWSKMKSALRAVEDGLFQLSGVDRGKMARAAYLAKVFGVGDPRVIYSNLQHYEARFNSMSPEDRARLMKSPALAADRRGYEKFVADQVLSSESRRLVESLNAAAKRNKAIDLAVRPAVATALRFAGAVEGLATGKAGTQFELMADALDDGDAGRLEWAAKSVVAAGASMALYGGLYMALRAGLTVGGGILGGPVGAVIGSLLATAGASSLELLVDSRDVYRRVYQQTGDHELALRRAALSGVVESIPTIGLAKLGIFTERPGMSFGKRLVASAIGESVQEGAQGVVTTAYGEDVPLLSRETWRSFVTDFLVSLPAAGLVGAVTTRRAVPGRPAGGDAGASVDGGAIAGVSAGAPVPGGPAGVEGAAAGGSARASVDGDGGASAPGTASDVPSAADLLLSPPAEWEGLADDEIIRQVEHGDVVTPRLALDDSGAISPTGVARHAEVREDAGAVSVRQDVDDGGAIPDAKLEAAADGPVLQALRGRYGVTGGESIRDFVDRVATDEFIDAVARDIRRIGVGLKMSSRRVKAELARYLAGADVSPVLAAAFDLQFFGAPRGAAVSTDVRTATAMADPRVMSEALDDLYSRLRKTPDGSPEAWAIKRKIKLVVDLGFAGAAAERALRNITDRMAYIGKIARGAAPSPVSPDVALALNKVVSGMTAAKSSMSEADVEGKVAVAIAEARGLFSRFGEELAGVDPDEVISAIGKRDRGDMTISELLAVEQFFDAVLEAGKGEGRAAQESAMARAEEISWDTVQLLYGRKLMAAGLREVAKERGKRISWLLREVRGAVGRNVSADDMADSVLPGGAADVRHAICQALGIEYDRDLAKRVLRYAESKARRRTPGRLAKDALAYVTNYFRLGTLITGEDDSELARFLRDDVIKADNAYSVGVDRRTRWIVDLIKQTYGSVKAMGDPLTIAGVTDTREHFLALYALARQQDGRAALQVDNGYSAEFLETVLRELPENDRAFAEKVSEELMSHFQEIQRGTYVRTGYVLSPAKFYFRLMRISSSSVLEGSFADDPFIALVNDDMEGRRKLSIEKRRTGGGEPRAPLSLDFLAIYNSSVQLQERVKAYSEVVAVFNRLLTDDDFTSLVQASSGEVALRALGEYRNLLLNPMKVYDRGAVASMLRTLRHFRALGVLTGNAVSVLRQFPSVINVLPYCSGRGVAVALSKFATGPLATWKQAFEMSPVVRLRSYNLVMAEARNQAQFARKPISRWWARFETLAMSPQSALDAAAVGMGWLAMYETAMAQHGDQARAIEYADRGIVETQPQGEVHRLNLARTQGGVGGEMLRNFTLFANQLTQNFGILTVDAPAAIRRGDYGLACKMIAAQFVAGAFIVAIGAEIADLGELTEATLIDMLKIIPLVGPVIAAGASGTSFRSSYSGFDVFYDAGAFLGAIGEGDPDKIIDKGLKLIYSNSPLPWVAARRFQRYLETGDIADAIGYRRADY